MLSIWAPPAHASEDSRQVDRQLPGLEEQWPGQADPPTSDSHSSGRFRQASVGVSHHSDRCPREEQKTHVTCQASAPVPLAGTSHVARPRVGAGRAAPTGVNGAGRRCRRPAPAGLRGRFRALEPPLSQGGSSVIGQPGPRCSSVEGAGHWRGRCEVDVARVARRGHGASARETGAVTTTTNGLRVAPGHRRRATGSSWGRRLPPLWPPWRDKGSVPPAVAPLSPSPRDRGHGARDAAAPADTALRARGCHLSVGTSPRHPDQGSWTWASVPAGRLHRASWVRGQCGAWPWRVPCPLRPPKTRGRRQTWPRVFGEQRVCFCSLPPNTWPSMGFRSRAGEKHAITFGFGPRGACPHSGPAVVARVLHRPLNQTRSWAGAGATGRSAGGGAQQLGSVGPVGPRPLLAQEP